MENNKLKISYETFVRDTESLAELVKEGYKHGASYGSIYGIPRGGVPVAVILSSKLGLPLVDEVQPDSLVVDDLVDSGKTLEKYPDNDTAVLYAKPHSRDKANYQVAVLEGWIEFPYEQTNEDVEENFRRILEYLGEDPTREGLVETPKRYIKFMKQFLTPEEFNFTTFENEGTDEMIIQKDIPFFSLCEHHTAPFFGTATVAYIPGERIVGLSKLARTVKYYAGRFQNQERITQQVADRLEKELAPLGVAVTLKARHFCMEMRGVKTHDVHTVTTKVTGVFKEKPETRAEYMGYIK